MNRVENYGTQLQMYALYKTILNLGYDCRIVDYDRGVALSSSAIKYLIKNIISRGGLAKKNRAFQKVSNLCKYTETLKKNDLFRLNEELDCAICGSDQIWNPEFTGLDSANYLDFMEKNKRVAYAASIGLNCNNVNIPEQILSNIREINKVSVREKDLNDNLIKLGINSTHVLDPTLLFSSGDWDAILSNNVKRKKNCYKKYLLKYGFQGDDEKNINEICTTIAKKNDLELIDILPKYSLVRNKQIQKRYEVGPFEFVDYIKNASWLITNSYHGLLFALLYEVPFWCVPKSYATGDISSRLISTLGDCNLSNRLITSTFCNEELDKAPCFNDARAFITINRNKSINWLRTAIEDIK